LQTEQNEAEIRPYIQNVDITGYIDIYC